MKELSIKQKAQRYDEALKAAVVAHKDEDKHLKATLERIFPELKESEGEKIRKGLINGFNFYSDQEYWGTEKFQLKIKDIIAWLEKQGEQKPTENKGMNIVKEDMTPFQKKVFCIIDTAIEEEQGLKQVCDELLRLAHDEIMQNPAWSEEDEKMLEGTIDKISDLGTGEMCKEWLKSLKDRVQPQPKQEWSEEDEEHLSDAIFFVREYQIPTRDKRLLNAAKEAEDWLKSLRPQTTWKPSDKQMKALSIAMCGVDDPLFSLYQDLKKLREE